MAEAPVVVQQIPDLIGSILLIRDQRVMLASELASLYGVETKVLMQAVKRNLNRFPADFMFQLNTEEWGELKAGNLRSQIVTSSSGSNPQGGTRYRPYVFTEQGVAMLSSVLKSDRAVRVNIEIMRTFVRLRGILSENTDLAHRLDLLEAHYDEQFKVVFDALRQLMNPPQQTGRPIGFVVDDSRNKERP